MPSRRAASEGTIDWRIRDGQRVARVRLRMPDGRRRAFYAPPEVQTDQEADAFRGALLMKLSGTVNDPRARGATLGAFGLRWLEERKKTHRDAAGDEQRWRGYIASTELATKKLGAITPGDVLRWMKALLKRPSRRGGLLDRQTARNAATTLRACLRAAIEAEAIGTDLGASLLNVELPRGTIAQHVETEEGFDVHSDAEIDRIIAAADPDARCAYVVSLVTLLRPSDLHRLDWSRVVLDGPMPHVVAIMAKNGRADRVPLLGPALAELRVRWRAAGKPTAGLVWPGEPDEHGAPQPRPRGWDWGWSGKRQRRPLAHLEKLRAREKKGELRIVDVERAAKKVLIEWPGLRDRARVRALTWYEATKHTGASQLLMGAGWVARGWIPRAYRIEEVSRLCRHSSIAVTERHYARFLPDALPGAVRQEKRARAPRAKGGSGLDLPEGSPLGPRSAETPSFSRETQGSPHGFVNRRSGVRIPEVAWKSEWVGTHGTHAGTHTSTTLRELAADVLQRVAARDPLALRRAVELAAAVLDQTVPIALDGTETETETG